MREVFRQLFVKVNIVIFLDVVIIEKESWKTIATIGKHPDMVNQVAWSANGAYLAASSMDGTLSIWHPEFSIIQPIKRFL